MTANDWLVLLVPYLVPIVFAVAGTTSVVAYQHLLKFLPEKQRSILEFAVNSAVSAVQQTMPDAANHDKKMEAVLRATEILSHFGLRIPVPIVDTVIESAVNELNAVTSQKPVPAV